MIAAAVPVGALIGLSLGALGGGGSILTVPALVYLLHQSPHVATTGSLIVVGFTAAAGAVVHWRGGRVRVGPGLAFGALGVGGSYLGTRLSAGVDPHVLLAAFAGLMVVAALAMARRRPLPSTGAPDAPPDDLDPEPDGAWREADGGGVGTLVMTTRTSRLDTRAIVRVIAAATVVGLLTGFFGVGGGFVIVPALVLVLGFPMPAAVGTSLLVIAVNSSAALVARLGGHAPPLDWTLLAAFSLAAVAGAFAGTKLASRLKPARLNTAFLVLLLLVASYTAARSLPHIL